MVLLARNKRHNWRLLFIDVDKDGTNNEYGDDNVPISDLSQKFYGGLQNSFSYKSFQLSFLFQFVKQTVFNSAFRTGCL